MLGIPSAVTAATGIDALTHALESYISVGAHKLTDYISLEAIKIIAEFLPQAVDNGSSMDAREMMAYGQFIAGLSFNSAGLGMVHAMGSSSRSAERSAAWRMQCNSSAYCQ